MKQPKSKEEKLTIINECRNNGQPDNVWCKQHNIPASTLHGWVKKFKAKGYIFPEPAGRKTPITTNEVVKLDILPDFGEAYEMPGRSDITATGHTSAPLEASTIEMTLGKLSLKFSGDINPLLFEKALSAFGECIVIGDISRATNVYIICDSLI